MKLILKCFLAFFILSVYVILYVDLFSLFFGKQNIAVYLYNLSIIDISIMFIILGKFD